MSDSPRGDVPTVPEKLRSALKPAQEAALAELEAGELSELTRARYEEIGAVSRSQAAYDLADMVTLGILERVGTGRATRYRLPGTRAEPETRVERNSSRERPPKPAAERSRRPRSGGRPRKWTDERIRAELEAFCGAKRHWPRAAEFRRAGRSDLYLAASRYGGIDRWAAELGLRERPSRRPRIRIPAISWGWLGGWAPAAVTMAVVVGLAAALLEVDRAPWTFISVERADEGGEALSARAGGGDRPEGLRTQLGAAPEKIRAAKRTAPAAAEEVSRPSAHVAAVQLTARGGACWLSIRRGSTNGATVYEGTLTTGRSLLLHGKRLWLRLGAPHNLVARVNGRRADLPERTSTVVITRRGIRILRVAAPSPPPPEEPAVVSETPVLASSTVTTSPPPTAPARSSSGGAGGSSGSGGTPSPEPAPAPSPAPSPDPKP